LGLIQLGKLEGPDFESFIPERIAIEIPIEDFKSIAAFAAKQKPGSREGIMGRGKLHKLSEGIEAFAHIGGSDMEIDFGHLMD